MQKAYELFELCYSFYNGLKFFLKFFLKKVIWRWQNRRMIFNKLHRRKYWICLSIVERLLFIDKNNNKLKMNMNDWKIVWSIFSTTENFVWNSFYREWCIIAPQNFIEFINSNSNFLNNIYNKMRFQYAFITKRQSSEDKTIKIWTQSRKSKQCLSFF